MKNPPLILAVVLAATAGLFVLSTVLDRSPVVSEQAASVQETSADWSNCSRVQIPLEINMDVQNVIENQGGAQENGGLVEIQLGMKPLMETNELSWHLVLPEGVTTYSGPSSWTGMIGKDQSAFLRDDPVGTRR